MRLIVAILMFLVLVPACTRDVPEAEKKIIKIADEDNARKTIQSFADAYNSNDLEKAISFFDLDYKSVVADSDALAGVDALRNEIINSQKEFPEGKWEITIDEGNISGEFAYFICSSSFLMPDVIEKNLNPIYSEKSIRILKKQKDGSWKIYRYVSTPIFTYDQK
ncbi:MAG: hypothetical protein HY963_01015 [Ignavibacteriales bacterium]|nr:hypothetical protein [Ignavibacteriales bacterium]